MKWTVTPAKLSSLSTWYFVIKFFYLHRSKACSMFFATFSALTICLFRRTMHHLVPSFAAYIWVWILNLYCLDSPHNSFNFGFFLSYIFQNWKIRTHSTVEENAESIRAGHNQLFRHGWFEMFYDRGNIVTSMRSINEFFASSRCLLFPEFPNNPLTAQRNPLNFRVQYLHSALKMFQHNHSFTLLQYALKFPKF